MSSLGYHLVFRLQDDRVFAPSVAQRRRLAAIFARLARAFPVLAWRVVDTHLHVLGLFADDGVDELARRLRIHVSLLHPGVPLHLSRRVAVQSQWHLAEAFGYVLRQDVHHGVGSDPLQEGSCVLDLLGMRVLGSPLATRVREHLPRVRREHLVAHLGVSALLEGACVDHLRDATCAAFALPSLDGNQAVVVSAREAAVCAVGRGAPSSAIAQVLNLSCRTVQRLAWSEPSPSAVRAVRLQMALRIARPEPVASFVVA